VTHRLLAALAVAAVIAGTGCNFAASTGMIRKDILTDSQQVVVDTKLNAGSLTIEAAVDRSDSAYAVGEPITLSVKTDKPASVAILRVLANGDTVILYPNKTHPKAAVAAGAILTVPGSSDTFKITVDKPQLVVFEFIASSVADAWLFHRATDEGSNFADLGGTTRAIAKDIAASLRSGTSPQTAATYLTVKIE
jgi:hypothetical protein